MAKKVEVVTEYRKCGCVYEKAEGVLIRRRYCKEHPAAEESTKLPFVVHPTPKTPKPQEGE